MQQLLVLGQCADEAEDQRRVGGDGRANLDGLGQPPRPIVTPGGGTLSSGTKKSGISGEVGSTRY